MDLTYLTIHNHHFNLPRPSLRAACAPIPSRYSANHMTFHRQPLISSCSVALLALLLLGCEKRGGGQTAGATGDYVTGTPLPERREGTSFFGGNVDRARFQPIYFDFDSQSVRSSESGKIQQIASFMQESSSEIIIAGFTDERGTAEYNRGLGDRRAGAVRESLISQGVDANRIQTVSFGLEMPADSGHNEAAWAKNRRAEIGVVR
jgi:peptidoglycan-associated lipoprotein